VEGPLRSSFPNAHTQRSALTRARSAAPTTPPAPGIGGHTGLKAAEAGGAMEGGVANPAVQQQQSAELLSRARPVRARP
jgi:hypothetical protein